VRRRIDEQDLEHGTASRISNTTQLRCRAYSGTKRTESAVRFADFR
jgi:hypothetical protein